MPGFDEYPSNSHRSKEETPPEPPKNIEQVTTGKVVRQKQSLGRRFTSLFIAGDSDSVMQYVFMEVLLPGARDMVADAVTQYAERMIFGGPRSAPRRGAGAGRVVGSGGPGYTSYNRFSQKPSLENPRAGISAQDRATHNFDRIVLDNRYEADEVIDRLFDLISRYEQATVSEFYELVGETGSFTDQKWGWRDIRGAEVKRVRTGYLLVLPQPILLVD